MGLNEFLKSAFALTIGLLMSPFMVLHMIYMFVQSRGKVSWKKYDMPDCLRDPAYGTHHFVHLEDVRLHYVAAGDEDKPLMLLVHGLPEFWFSWRYQIKEFKKYYRVVAIDQRGYSESGAPSGVSSYNLRELAKDIKQLVPALGYKSCVLVGHDWGGAVAWTVAGLHPEVVDKLIIMNCPPPQAYVRYLVTHLSQIAMCWFQFFFTVPVLPELYCCFKDRWFWKTVSPANHLAFAVRRYRRKNWKLTSLPSQHSAASLAPSTTSGQCHAPHSHLRRR
ncbi:epoxide hydrolase 4-like [Haliotis rubra]|uniref:epoxide hydrolase 4-like n=1 Tax=Haliotis rubra TaxID=36100 RepID=UPI001EE512A1|nr:epoxide hydrolase 4-like [Haliotis rubra]